MAAAAAAANAAPPAKTSAHAPAWLGKSGPARIMGEMKSLHKSIASGVLPGVRRLTSVCDDTMVWRLEVFQFDADTRAGRTLNKDLEFLGRTWGPKHAVVELELRFPDNYPDAPFFLRVVRPRMAAYSGHVTAGGAVCLEALSLSGGPGSWRSDMCAEAVLVMVLHNMLHAEEVYVETAMGGGQAGPLRINRDLGRACLQEYSLKAAEEAYRRTVAQHGWGRGRVQQAARPAGGGAAAAAAAGMAGSRFAAAPTAMAGSGRPSWVPGPVAGAQPPLQRSAAPLVQQASLAQHKAAAATPPAKKRPAVEVIVVSDSEDEGPSVPRRPPAKRAQHSGPQPVQAAAAPAAAQGAGPAARGAGAVQRSGLGSGEVVDLTVQASHRSLSAGRPQAVAQRPAAATAPPQQEQQLSLCERLFLKESQLPPHWKVSEELLRGELVLVDLRLPEAAPPQDRRHERAVAQLVLNGCSREQAVDIVDAHGGDAEASLAYLLEQQQAAAAQADPAAVAELLANGLTVEDAEAALRQCDGNVDTALAWAADCVEVGGPAAVERLTGAPAAARSPGVLPAAKAVAAHRRQAQRAEREAQHRRLQEESGRVLECFGRSGMRKEQVQGIQRVQSLHLYSDYRRRRDKIEWHIRRSTGGARVGALLNERQLFHGADKETLATIMSEGFDHRVSNISDAMGADDVAMLLCDVTLGIAGVGQPAMRRAAPGSHSSTSGLPGSAIHAVYHNDQAYPAYLIHYR